MSLAHAARRPAFGWLLLVLTAGSFGLSLWLTPELLRSSALTAGLSLLLIFVAMGPILVRVAARTLDIADLSFWYVFVFIAHFGLGGLYVTQFGSRFLGLGPNDSLEQINTGLLIAILSIVCFWAAYLSDLGRRLAVTARPLSAEWDRQRVLTVCLVTLAIGWTFRLLLMQITAGSIVGWLSANKDKLLLDFEGLTYVAAFGTLSYVALLGLFIGARALGDRRLWMAFWTILPLEMGYRFLSGSRNQLVFFLLQLLIAYCLTADRNFRLTKRMFGWTMGIVMLLAVLYPITTAARVYGFSRIGQLFQDQPQFATPTGFLWLVGNRLHGLESLSLIAREVPAHEEYTYGEELGMKAVAWVPRAVWPTKPQLSQGQKFREQIVPPGLYGEGAAVAVTMPGEFYWAFGVVGVLVGMGFVGLLWRFLNDYLVTPKGNLSNALVVATMFPTFLMAVEQELGYLLTFHLFVMILTLVSVRFLRPAPREVSA